MMDVSHCVSLIYHGCICLRLFLLYHGGTVCHSFSFICQDSVSFNALVFPFKSGHGFFDLVKYDLCVQIRIIFRLFDF